MGDNNNEVLGIMGLKKKMKEKIHDDNSKRVANFISEMEHGGIPDEKLKLDSKTGRLIITSSNQNTNKTLTEISMDEAKMFAFSHIPTLVLLNNDLKSFDSLLQENNDKQINLLLQSIDNCDVFKLSKNGNIEAYLFDMTEKEDQIESSLNSLDSNDRHVVILYNRHRNKVTSYLFNGVEHNEINVIIPPAKDEIFSRVKGIYETKVLANKTVLIIGLGSGGSPIALELAKQGVQNFILVDYDKLETANISRHICGMNDLGRFKTKAVSDMLKTKNPYVNITTYELNIIEASKEAKESLFHNSDLVICGTDNRESKMVINRLCIEYDRVCIYGGAFRRAYGGQVLKVTPHQTLCYQCFINQLPNLAEDYEISNLEQAHSIAYSDIPLVSIEPGLSTDIAPISTFITKLAILELLKNDEHTMENLYEDLSEALYIWFNRREDGTDWRDVLLPMEDNIGSMSILRWYGISTKKNEHCSVCGNFQIGY